MGGIWPAGLARIFPTLSFKLSDAWGVSLLSGIAPRRKRPDAGEIAMSYSDIVFLIMHADLSDRGSVRILGFLVDVGTEALGGR